MSILNNIIKRLDINNDSDNYLYYDNNKKEAFLNNMQRRLNVRGGTDQWTRMRQDKLKSLRKALLYSYQSAVVEKYDVQKENVINNISSIITVLENKESLTDEQKEFLSQLEQEFLFLEADRASIQYITQLENIRDYIIHTKLQFRCLINHDKLKVDYEDKIISIPFSEPPIGRVDPVQTGFHNGTVFKWVHGNKEEWTPDTYWIVYMQYSEETAYFRAEIRKADEEIEIIIVDDEGNENSVKYRGWMTGPNQTTALWNVKKNKAWNDMNYTKLLYITKDEDTLAFFQRFDRVVINGKPWEVQAYNENYTTSRTGGVESGIIRVALKQTYIGSDQFVRQSNAAAAADAQKQASYDAEHTEPRIDGPRTVLPYSIITYTAKNIEQELHWSLSSSLAKIVEISEDKKQIKVEILTGFSSEEGFDIKYGDSQEAKIHVTIESF